MTVAMPSDDDLDLVRGGMADFAARALAPYGAQGEDEGRLPVAVAVALSEHGVWSIARPEVDGGAGLSLLECLTALETLAEVDAGVAWAVAAQVLAYAAGDAAGIDLGAACWSFDIGEASEPWILVQASRVAGHIRLAPASLRLRVVRREAWEERGGGGSLGFSLRSAERWRFEGELQDATVASISSADGSRIEAWAALSAAAIALGLARAATQDAVAYATTREQFGRPIASFQAIAHKVADLALGVDAGMLLVRAAASAVMASPAESVASAASALAFVSSMARRSCSESLQIHGGYGYTLAFPVERRLRDAQASAAGFGALARLDRTRVDAVAHRGRTRFGRS